LAKSGTQAFFGFTGIGEFVAVTFAGLFIGTFFLGFLSDRYGRRFIFTHSFLWHRCNRQHSLPDFDRASGWASKSLPFMPTSAK
jgi:MFS family permease